MQPLSVILITKNEERYLQRCLNSVAWADEIVVVDALSDDRTRAIAQDPKAAWAGKIRWLEREWTGFREQRNFALDSAKNDWILSIDADEECSSQLKTKLQSILSKPGQTKYFKVKRIEYFLGKPISYGIWNPSYQDRFFHRSGVKYVNEIHEYAKYPALPERIHEPLIHAPDFAPEKFLDKMNKYTSIEARDRVRQGQRTNVFRMFFAFPAMFLKNYFYYKAYRDGMHGFVISLLEGISRTVRHIKIWQYCRVQDKKDV